MSNQNRVVLVYKDSEGKIANETIWVQVEGNNFKVDSIPFFAPNLAMNDIISVEYDEGTMYFDGLIYPSGHSTIQIIFFQLDAVNKVLKILEGIGCTWEGLKNNPYFTIDIPTTVNYEVVRDFLNRKLAEKILDFKEACLSDIHAAMINRHS